MTTWNNPHTNKMLSERSHIQLDYYSQISEGLKHTYDPLFNFNISDSVKQKSVGHLILRIKPTEETPQYVQAPSFAVTIVSHRFIDYFNFLYILNWQHPNGCNNEDSARKDGCLSYLE